VAALVVAGNREDPDQEIEERSGMRSAGSPGEDRAAVVHVRDGCDVYIGNRLKRGKWSLEASKWGNPFKIGRDGDRGEVIERYRRWITEGEGRRLLEDLHELEDKRLGCWCAPKPCHGDVLLELASSGASATAEDEERIEEIHEQDLAGRHEDEDEHRRGGDE
jgi:hypothetical protein